MLVQGSRLTRFALLSLSLISCILHTSAIFYFSPFTRTHTYACARLLAPKFLRSIKTPSHIASNLRVRGAEPRSHALNPRFPRHFFCCCRASTAPWTRRQHRPVLACFSLMRCLAPRDRRHLRSRNLVVPVRTRLSSSSILLTWDARLRMSSTCQSIFAGYRHLSPFLSELPRLI